MLDYSEKKSSFPSRKGIKKTGQQVLLKDNFHHFQVSKTDQEVVEILSSV